MPAITHQTMTVLFYLQSDNDRAVTPTIYQPTDRRALCLTTIITAAGTVLPPGQTAATPRLIPIRPLLLRLQLIFDILLLCLQHNN